MDYEVETQEYFWEDDAYGFNIVDASDYVSTYDERDEYPLEPINNYENYENKKIGEYILIKLF